MSDIKNTKPLLIIGGMHRSGTSTITRVCHLLGAELGEGLIPALPDDNDLGFWELQEMVDIHEAMLEAQGLNHLSARVMPTDWQQRIPSALITQLRARIRKETNQHLLWAVKDPRMCRLLPVWIALCEELKISPRFLITIRHPVEVANSLLKRNQLPLEEGLRLWSLYNLELEKHTRGFPRYFVGYPDILSTWQQHVHAMQGALQLSWLTPVEAAHPEIAAFLKPDLYRQRANYSRLHEHGIHDALYDILHPATLNQHLETRAMDVLFDRAQREYLMPIPTEKTGFLKRFRRLFTTG